jgi:hypothetical protein
VLLLARTGSISIAPTFRPTRQIINRRPRLQLQSCDLFTIDVSIVKRLALMLSLWLGVLALEFVIVDGGQGCCSTRQRRSGLASCRFRVSPFTQALGDDLC